MDGLDLTDKPVTIFHGKMFTPKNLTPLKDLGGEGGKCVIWGDVFFTEVKGNDRKIYTVSITDYTGSCLLYTSISAMNWSRILSPVSFLMGWPWMKRTASPLPLSLIHI